MEIINPLMLAGFDRALRHPSRTASRETSFWQVGYPDWCDLHRQAGCHRGGWLGSAGPPDAYRHQPDARFITPTTDHRGTLGRLFHVLNPTRKRAALGLGRLSEQNLAHWPLAPRPQTEPCGANGRKANRRKENLSKVHPRP